MLVMGIIVMLLCRTLHTASTRMASPQVAHVDMLSTSWTVVCDPLCISKRVASDELVCAWPTDRTCWYDTEPV